MSVYTSFDYKHLKVTHDPRTPTPKPFDRHLRGVFQELRYRTPSRETARQTSTSFKRGRPAQHVQAGQGRRPYIVCSAGGAFAWDTWPMTRPLSLKRRSNLFNERGKSEEKHFVHSTLHNGVNSLAETFPQSFGLFLGGFGFSLRVNRAQLNALHAVTTRISSRRHRDGKNAYF